jgi:serine/threonine protein kinase
MTAVSPLPSGEGFDRGHRLTLDFECLRSIPEGINEVRVWRSELLGCEQVGKRIDISSLEDDVLPEAQILMSIDHRNVVPIRTAALVDGYPSPMRVVEIVTPYYPRGSITDALLRGEHFTCRQAVAIVQAALRGLAELHEVHGIIHRDMKSGNILLTSDGSVARVADLGLAGRMDDHGEVLALNNPTLYTPPEHFVHGKLGRESDLYPMSLILRELVGGALPYESYTMTMVAARLARQINPVTKADRALPVWTPRDLRRVIAKAGRRDRLERYRNAREMDQALARTCVADWAKVGPTRWEAPIVHRPDERISVEARPTRSGELRMSVCRYRTTWRRVLPDEVVSSLDSPEARQVFDRATKIAAAR